MLFDELPLKFSASEVPGGDGAFPTLLSLPCFGVADAKVPVTEVVRFPIQNKAHTYSTRLEKYLQVANLHLCGRKT